MPSPDSRAELTDEIAEGLLRTVVKNGRAVLDDPGDYDTTSCLLLCRFVL